VSAAGVAVAQRNSLSNAAPYRTRSQDRIAIALAFGMGSALALAVAGWLTLVAPGAAQSSNPAWTEVPWPFPMDEWGRGKAFRCSAAHCGAETVVYLRAKIGFCNCTSGIVDDEELGRLGDVALIGGHATALDAGKTISVGWMKGRSRLYRVANRGGDAIALTAAFHNDCDALVGTAVFDGARPADAEFAATRFLNSSTALDWARVELGL
jgi:hypothetical protein